MSLSSFTVSLHPSLLPSYSPLITVAVTRLRSDLLGKPRPVCPYESKSQEPAKGTLDCREKVNDKKKRKTGRWWRCCPRWICRPLVISLPLESSISFRIWDRSRRAGLQNKERREEELKGILSKPNVPKRLSQTDTGWWRSPPGCIAYPDRDAPHMWVLLDNAGGFVIRRISRTTNALKHQPLVKLNELSVTFGHSWRC